MPPTVANPRDLFLVGLADVLFVERMLAFEVLPELLKRVSDAELSAVLAEHLAETKEHAAGDEAAFRAVGAEPSSAHSPPFVGLKERHSELAGNVKATGLADLLHATAVIHTEHYEIAAYRTLVGLAAAMGRPKATEPLERNLADERRALERLEAVAARLAEQAAA